MLGLHAKNLFASLARNRDRGWCAKWFQCGRKYLFRTLLFLFGLVALYLFTALVGGVLPVNRGYQTPATGIPIYLQSNGAHIDLIFPVTNCACSQTLAPRYTVLEQPFDMATTHPQWLAVGWGDESFMLHVPTWNDLTFSIALRAVSGLDHSVIRLSAYYEPQMGLKTVRLLITPEQYQRLLQHVRQDMGPIPQEVAPGIPAQGDRFYRSVSRYSLFITCNEWMRQTVAQAGIRTVWWTPFDGELLRHFGR